MEARIQKGNDIIIQREKILNSHRQMLKRATKWHFGFALDRTAD